MADTKVSALAAATVALAQEIPVNDAGTSKKLTVQKVLDAADILSAAAALADANSFALIQSAAAKEATLTQLVTYLQTKGMPRIARLGSQHSISSTTGTKVTGLDMTLEAGTYVYQYNLLIQQATSTSDAPQFGINFSTGTAAVKAHGLRWWDASTAITAETHIMDNIGIKTAGFVSGMVSNAYTTTSPDMGTTVGVAATGVNIFAIIEGIIVVTVQGNLELWRSSEGANASTTEVGSSLTIIRTA
jgi:hypothetical protein